MVQPTASPSVKRYGQGAPYQFPEDPEGTIRFLKAGVDDSISPSDLQEGESPNAFDVRLRDGGVSSDYDVALVGVAYAGAGVKTIMAIAEFTRENLTNLLYRMRPAGWDRWNGTVWLTLPGSVTGSATDYLSVVSMQDRICAANKGADRIQSHDGLDASSVGDLSADAPRAWYIARFGNRMIAVRIDDGAGNVNPHRVEWSTDGDITDWTTANLGAGGATLLPEGRGTGLDFMTGASAIRGTLALYRERSITLGVATGVGAAPFRFETPVFGVGTEASYSIASGGPTVGDLFLGHDLNVYLFDGRNAPVAIGDKVHKWLRTNVDDPAKVVGVIDFLRHDYWLMVNTLAGGRTAWILNVDDLFTERRISWRRRDLPSTYTSVGFGKTAPSGNPVIDSVTSIIDTVSTVIDSFTGSVTFQELVFGDTAGAVRGIDNTSFISGTYETKQFGDPDMETTIDRIYLYYIARNNASVTISVSVDGGTTYINPQTYTVTPTKYEVSLGKTFGVTGHVWQLKIQIVSGDITITKVHVKRVIRGPVAA